MGLFMQIIGANSSNFVQSCSGDKAIIFPINFIYKDRAPNIDAHYKYVKICVLHSLIFHHIVHKVSEVKE